MSTAHLKHPRTTNEAFPHTAEYGCAVQRFDRRDSAVMTACAVATVSLLAILWIWG